MPTLLGRIKNAMNGARIGWNVVDEAEIDVLSPEGYGAFSARRSAYAFLTSAYNQEAFREQADVPDRFKGPDQAELYAYIRDILGIAYALGEFYTTYLQGGPLDPAMGDGVAEPSALPILFGSAVPEASVLAVRGALAELMMRSNYAVKKDLVSYLGSSLGDVFIEARDDFAARRMRLNVMHPGRVKRCEKDEEGNVQEYEYEWKEKHPERPGFTCTYSEIARRAGDVVQYQTYLDRRPYAWQGNPTKGGVPLREWEVSGFGFVPLVHVQHKDVALGWGQAEVQNALSMWREVSDLGCCLTDWARRALHSPHLVAGSQAPGELPTGTRTTQVDETEGTRDRSSFMFVTNPQAHADPLLTPMPVNGLVEYLELLMRKQRQDYPEISLQNVNTAGTVSGETIRRAREPAAKKVRQRRQSYHGPTAAVMKMALTMGGVLGYRGYEGITIDSYNRGELDFRIGPTEVFDRDPQEDMDEKVKKFTAIKTATDSGLPLEFVLREFGYSEEVIAATLAEKETAQARSLQVMRESQALALADLNPDPAEAAVQQ